MESTDKATIEVFTIGPSSPLGRVFALQVLFCKITWQLWLTWRNRAQRGIHSSWAIFKIFISAVLQKVSLRGLALIFWPSLLAFLIYLQRKRATKSIDENYRKKFWKSLLKSAHDYEEWFHAANLLQSSEGESDVSYQVSKDRFPSFRVLFLSY